MKTAMQELIEFTEMLSDDLSRKELDIEIIGKAQELLETEKQQIICAFDQGQTDEENGWMNTPEEYYNETYTNLYNPKP